MKPAADRIPGPVFELSIGDDAYPPQLRLVPDAPKRLYGIGNPAALTPGVAVIGARNATPYGINCAELFAGIAARRGLCVISGGARGCDQAAHRAALAAGGPTVVVFGSGADVTYPKSGRKLFERVVESGGAIISENPWGTEPHRGCFPRRNRIIAGLSMMLVITEAGLPSGTFLTADYAVEYDRVLAVVPGAITSPNSKGSNHLLAQGASALIDEEAFDTALERAFAAMPLSMLAPDEGAGALSVTFERALEDPLLLALSADGYTVSELAAYFGFGQQEAARRISEFELKGLVERGRDGRYRLRIAPPAVARV